MPKISHGSHQVEPPWGFGPNPWWLRTPAVVSAKPASFFGASGGPGGSISMACGSPLRIAGKAQEDQEKKYENNTPRLFLGMMIDCWAHQIYTSWYCQHTQLHHLAATPWWVTQLDFVVSCSMEDLRVSLLRFRTLWFFTRKMWKPEVNRAEPSRDHSLQRCLKRQPILLRRPFGLLPRKFGAWAS